MYRVTLFLDESKNKNYYQSYKQSDDTTVGNITCEELPPFQDINKARACYWDSDSLKWVFDEEKYSEILAVQAEAKTTAEKEAAVMAATPSNDELAVGLIDLAENIANHDAAIAELGEMISKLMEGGAV